MRCPKVPCVLVTLLLLTAPSSAFAEDSWTGKKVFMKEAGVKIGRTSPEGEQIITGKITSAVVTVLAEKDGWLKVRVNGKEGWFDKEKAILLSDAVDYYTERIRADSKSWFNYAQRAIAWGKRGEFDIAIKDYDEAIRLNPKDATTYCNRGGAWTDKKDYDRAIKDFDEAIRLDPKYAIAYYNRGFTYKAKKDYDKAIKAYSEAIRIDSKYADAYNNLAWILATSPKADNRDGKKAIEYATKACKLNEWKDASDVGTLAAAFAETGDFKEALKRTHQAIALGFDNKDDLEEARQMLKLFQDGKPWRDK